MSVISGLYMITQASIGLRYVGSAVNIARRWSLHRHHLERGQHQNSHLQRAWDKHGEADLRFEVLEVVAVADLIPAEQAWLDRLDFDTLFNARRIASSNVGVRHTAESRAKMSARKKGVAPTAATKEAQQKWATGRTHSLETRMKMIRQRKGKKMSDAARANMSAAAFAREAKRRQPER